MQTNTLVFIDTNVANAQTLAQNIQPGTEVILLDPTQNGIEQITQILAEESHLDSVQIISHGSEGQLQLGTTVLNHQTLQEYQTQLQQWGEALTENGDILLFGCNVATGEGQTFIEQLSQMTGADVAASDDLTGNALLGGDWELEVTTGEIESVAAISPEIQQTFTDILPISVEYFDGTNFKSWSGRRNLPGFEKRDWGNGAPEVSSVGNDNFSLRWTGYIYADKTGNYTFYEKSDDGVRLWVNNREIIDDWTPSGFDKENSGSVNLEAGQWYPIQMDYFEKDGGAAVELQWQPPGESKQDIPSQYLVPLAGENQQGKTDLGYGLKGEYFNNRDLSGTPVYTQIDSAINFDWGGDSPNNSVNNANFSVRWTGSLVIPETGYYQFYTEIDDGVRLKINNSSYIERWSNASQQDSGKLLSFQKGEVIPIQLEYYENTGDAKAKLFWQAWKNEDKTEQFLEAAYVPSTSLIPYTPDERPSIAVISKGVSEETNTKIAKFTIESLATVPAGGMNVFYKLVLPEGASAADFTDDNLGHIFFTPDAKEQTIEIKVAENKSKEIAEQLKLEILPGIQYRNDLVANLGTVVNPTEGFGFGSTITGLEEAIVFKDQNFIAVDADPSFNLAESGEFTQEAWIFTNFTDSNSHGIIGYQSGTLQGYPSLSIKDKTSVEIGFGDGENWNSETVADVLNPNTWNHIATTFDGTDYKLYVNAVEIFSTSKFANKSLAPTQQLEIGKVGDSYFEGAIDELRLWNVARSAGDIQSSMLSQLGGDEEGLVGYWNFNKNIQNQVNQNESSNNNNSNFEYINNPSPQIGYVEVKLNKPVEDAIGLWLNYDITRGSAEQNTDFLNSRYRQVSTDANSEQNGIIIPQGEQIGRIYFSALSDALVEEDEKINISLVENNSDFIDDKYKYQLHPDTKTAEITIKDNQAYENGVILLDAANQIISQNNPLVIRKGQAEFQVQLSSQPTRNVTVNLSSNQGNLDSSSWTFTPSNWDTPQTVILNNVTIDGQITASAEGYFDNNITFNFTTDIPLRVTEGSNTDAIPVTPEVSISSQGDIKEDDGLSSNFIINLSAPAPENGITIQYEVSGSAIADTDYQEISNTGEIRIPAGETSGVLPILPIADEAKEINEDVKITLKKGNKYTLNNDRSQATLRILNDDNNGIEVVNAQISTDEEGDIVTNEEGNTVFNYSNDLVPLITSEPYPRSRDTVEIRDIKGEALGKATVRQADVNAGKITIQPTGQLPENLNQLQATLKEDDTLDVGIQINNSDIKLKNNNNVEIKLPSINNQAIIGIRLQTKPTANVTIQLINPNSNEVSLDKDELKFTPDNWDTYQPVTLTGLDDLIVDGEINYEIQAIAKSKDLDYENKILLIPIQNLDDDQQLDNQVSTEDENPDDNLVIASIGDGTTVTENEGTVQVEVKLSQPASKATQVIFDTTNDSAIINQDYQILQSVFINQFEPNGTPRFQSPFDAIDNLKENTKPTFADLDNDGDLDAIVGVQSGIQYYENVGGIGLPILEEKTGRKNPFHQISIINAAPTFGDLNNDGRLDLVVGTEEGNLVYYINNGTPNNPRVSHQNKLNQSDPFGDINVGKNATPFLIDMDGDGDLDVVTGSEGSADNLNTLHYFENTGSQSIPQFSEKTENPITQIQAGQNSSPFIIDWDQDGDLDILVGQKDGTVNLFSAEGNGYSATPEQLISSQTTAIQDTDSSEDTEENNTNNLPINLTNSAPTFADMDADGDLDAFVGSADGKIHYHEQFSAIQFAEGEQTKTINLKIKDDQIAEDNETIEINLRPNPGYQLQAPNKRLKFDGNDDYVEVIHPDESSNSDESINQNPLNITDKMTVEAKVYLDEETASGNRRILQKGNDNNQYRLFIEDGQLKFDLNQVGTVTAPLFSTKEWHHVAGVYDGEKITLYIDGEQVNSIDASGSINTTSDPLKIGEFWKGDIEEVRIWKTARTQTEIKQYQNQPLNSEAINSAQTNLIAYYQGDTNSQNQVSDRSIYNNNGELRNGATSGDQLSATITITDNDEAGVTITPNSENNITSEAGNSLSYRVKLNTQPTAPVSIYLGVQDETEARVTTNSDLSDLSEVTALEFTPENWNQEQTFYIKGEDDQIADGDLSYKIIPTVFSEDQKYQDLNVNDLSLINRDNDEAKIIVTGAGQAVEGRENVYSVRLNSQPVGEVRVTATPSNDQIRLNDEFIGEPHTLIFNPDNWDLNQTIRATALDDSVVEYLHTSKINFEVETGEGLDFESRADNNTPENALELGTIKGGYTWRNLAIAPDSNTSEDDTSNTEGSENNNSDSNTSEAKINDVDWFKFTTSDTGNNLDFVEIKSDKNSEDLTLELYKKDDLERPIATGNQGKIDLKDQPFGEYYLKVSGAANSSYDLIVADEDYQYTQAAPEPLDVVIVDNDLPTVNITSGRTASEVFGEPSYFSFQLNAPTPTNGDGIKVNYRLIGGSATLHEDINGNGNLEEGEDRNNNGTLDLGDYRMQTEGFVQIAPGDIQNNLVVVPIDDKLTEDLELEIITAAVKDAEKGLLTLTVKSPVVDTQSNTLDLIKDSQIQFADDLVATIKELSTLSQDTNSEFYQGTVTVEVNQPSRQSEIIANTKGRISEETVIVELLEGEGYLLPENPQAILRIQDDDVPGVRIVEVGEHTVVKEGETTTFEVSLLSEPTDDVTIRLTPDAEIEFVDPINPTTVEVDKDIYSFAETNIEDLEFKLNSLVTTEEGETVSFEFQLLEKPASNIIIEFYDANNPNTQAEASITLTAAEENIVLGEQEGNWNEVQQVTIADLDVNNNGDFALKARIKNAETQAIIGDEIELAINRETTKVEKKTTELTIKKEEWLELKSVTIKAIDETIAEPGKYHESRINYQVTSEDKKYNDILVPEQQINVIDRALDGQSTAQAIQQGFGSLQNSINELEIPLVGSLDGKAPPLIKDISDKLVAEISDEENISANRLKSLIEKALSTLGLDFIEVSLEMTDDEISVDLEIKKTYELFKLPLDADLGLDALGIGLKTEGGLQSTFDFKIGLGFGLHKDFGFYIDTEKTKVDAALKFDLDQFKGQGNLAFLRLDVEDDSKNPTELEISFKAGLNDLDNYQNIKFFDVDGDHQLDAETFNYLIKNPNKQPDPEKREVQEPFTAINAQGKDETFPTVGEAIEPAKRVNWNGNNSFDEAKKEKKEGIYRTKKDAQGNVERYYIDLNRNGRLDEDSKESLFSVTPGTSKWFDKQGKVKPFRIEKQKDGDYYFDNNGNNKLDTGETLTKKEKAKLDKDNNNKLDADIDIEGEGTFVQGTGIAFKDTNGNGKFDPDEPYVHSQFDQLKLDNSNLSLSFLDVNGDGQQEDNFSIASNLFKLKSVTLETNLDEPLILEGVDQEKKEKFFYLDITGDKEFTENYKGKNTPNEPKLIKDENQEFFFLDIDGNGQQNFSQEPLLSKATDNNAFLDIDSNNKRNQLLEPVINLGGSYLSFVDKNGDGKQQKLLDYNRDTQQNNGDRFTEALIQTGTYPNGQSFQFLDTSADGYWTREHQVIAEGSEQYLDVNDNHQKDDDDIKIIIIDSSNQNQIKQDSDKNIIYIDSNNNNKFEDDKGERKLRFDSFTRRFIQDTNGNDRIDDNEPVVNVRLVDSQLVVVEVKSTTIANPGQDPFLNELNGKTINYLDESQDGKFTREYQILTDDVNTPSGLVLDTNDNGIINFSKDVNQDDPLIVFTDAPVREIQVLGIETSRSYLDRNNNGQFDSEIDQEIQNDSITNQVNFLDIDNNQQFTQDGDIIVNDKKSDDLTFKFYDKNGNGEQDSDEALIFNNITFLDLDENSQLTDNDYIVNETYFDLNGNNINNPGEPQLKKDNWVIDKDNVITYKIINDGSRTFLDQYQKNTSGSKEGTYEEQHDIDLSKTFTLNELQAKTFLGLSEAGSYTAAKILGLTEVEGKILESEVTFVDVEGNKKLDIIFDPQVLIKEGVRFVDINNNSKFDSSSEFSSQPNNKFDEENLEGEGKIIKFLDDGDRLTLNELKNWKNDSDLGFSDLFKYEFAGNANLGLKTKTSIQGKPAFPSISFDLAVGLPLFNYGNQEDSGDTGLNVDFNNIKLDFGTFLTDFATPVINTVDKIISPAKPILDVLNADTKIFSYLGLEDEFNKDGRPGVSVIDIAAVLAEAIPEDVENKSLKRLKESVPKAVKFVDTVNKIVDATESLKKLTEKGETIVLDIGSYNLDDFKAASDDPADTASKVDPSKQGTQKSASGGEPEAPEKLAENNATEEQKSTFEKLKNLDGLEIPILNNPITLIQILLGQPDVDLIKYDIPDLEFGFSKEQEFLLYTPPTIQGLLELGFEAKTDFSVGYDTHGLEAWKESDFALSEVYKVLDGFYLDDWDDSGEEKDELSASARIAAGLSASVVVAKAVVKGGVDGTLGFDIIDEGELQGKNDGKVRGSEIISRLDTPLELFDLKGKLDAFLSGEIRIGFDVGLFEIMKTVWEKELGRTTLAKFNIGASGITFSSSISNSYIFGSTVFFDANFNNIWDEGEPVTFTNEYGQYNLDIGLEWDKNGDGQVDESDGKIIALGGIDSSSGLAAGQFIGLPNSTIITPLTSLQVPLTQTGLTADEADTLIKTQLGLGLDFNLETFDALNGVGQQEQLGLDIYLAHIQVQALFNQAQALINGLQGNPDNMQEVQAAFAEFLKNRAELTTEAYDFSDPTAITAFLTFLSEKQGVTLNNQQLEITAQIIAESHQFIQQVAEVGSSKSLTEALPALASVKRVVQGEIAQLIQQLPTAESLEEIQTQFENILYQNYIFVDGDINAFGNRSVKITTPNNYISEANSEATFTIELSQAAPNQGLKVLYSISGTATGQEDYMVSAGKLGEIEIAPGETTATITVSMKDDTVDEISESITINLKSVGEGYILDPTASVAFVQLNDDEATPDTDENQEDIDIVNSDNNTEEDYFDNDNLTGNAGDDFLDGEYGDDNLNGEEGDDFLQGGYGADLLRGGEDNDRLEGNFDNDTLEGEGGRDILDGGSGDDQLRGGDGVDQISGGTGKDTLEGNIGNDQLEGGADNDRIDGGTDNDWLVGDRGNDILFGGTGDDMLNGGEGADVFFFNSPNEGFDTLLDFDPTQGDKIQVSATGFGIENLDNFRFVSGVLDFNGKNLALIQNNGATYSYFPNLADIIEIVETPTEISTFNNSPQNQDIFAQRTPGIASATAVSNPEQTILDEIIQRGQIQVATSAVGSDFDLEFVRTLAAALFGDANQVEQIETSFEAAFDLVSDGDADLAAQRATNYLEADTLSVDFSPIYFYDHQAVVVRKDSGIENASDLNGRTIGMVAESNSINNLQQQLSPAGIEFSPQFSDSLDAYDRGEVDAYIADRGLILDYLKDLPDPDNHRLLDIEFSKEPISLVLPENDSQWSDVVRWVNYVPIQAEEFGINSENIDSLIAANTDENPNNDSAPQIRRFLGLEGNLGEALGLPNDFAVNVIEQVGSYEEIYQRHFPELDRDRNLSWIDGGLFYSPPFSGSEIAATLEDNDQRNLLAEVLQRDVLKLGLPAGNNPGFAVQQDNGEFTGFDVDLGRAIAAAVLGDASKLEIQPQSLEDSFANTANGVVDVSAMGMTHNLVRDARLGIDFSPTYLYAGQGVLVRSDSGITMLPTLNGRRVGVLKGATALQNLQDSLQELGGTVIPIEYATNDQLFAAYEAGEIDAVSTDLTILSSRIPTLSNPDEHQLLDDILSKEPIALITDENQSQWADVVRWVSYALVQAEEYGITSENIDQVIADNINNPSNTDIRQFLGLEGNLGESLGLPDDFAVKAIKAVGNYGEIYNRHFDSDLLRRDLNELSSEFGLQYVPSFTGVGTPIERDRPKLSVEDFDITALGLGIGETYDLSTSIEVIEFPTLQLNVTSESTVPTDDADQIVGTPTDDIIFGLRGNDNIEAGNGNDWINGNQDNDLIDGGDGNDTVFAGKGNDQVDGGSGDDSIFGNLGNDTLAGNAGNDWINGNQEDDLIDGGDGEDSLYGGKNDDQIRGGNGNDLVFGDLGMDLIEGNEGDDTLYGNSENDTISGNMGQDLIYGGQGNDLLDGNDGDDVIWGDNGDDILDGGEGNDQLTGGSGNDLLVGGEGVDTLAGGEGSDRFVLISSSASDLITDFTDGEDQIVLDGNLTFAQLSIVDENGSTLIQLEEEQLATIENVNASLITADDFVSLLS